MGNGRVSFLIPLVGPLDHPLDLLIYIDPAKKKNGGDGGVDVDVDVVVWCVVVWCGVVWCVVLCCGVVWCGVVWMVCCM